MEGKRQTVDGQRFTVDSSQKEKGKRRSAHLSQESKTAKCRPPTVATHSICGGSDPVRHPPALGARRSQNHFRRLSIHAPRIYTIKERTSRTIQMGLYWFESDPRPSATPNPAMRQAATTTSARLGPVFRPWRKKIIPSTTLFMAPSHASAKGLPHTPDPR